MTVQPNPAAFKIQPKTLFAGERSDWLDSFSRLEQAVLQCCERLCISRCARGKPFSQRLTMLAALPAGTWPEASLKKLRKLVRECELLLPRRANVVHSIMKIERREGRYIAVFQNNIDAACDVPHFEILSAEDFASDRKALQSLADRFKSLATASSPLRPKRDAAAGP
jgi:hypothetical protein